MLNELRFNQVPEYNAFSLNSNKNKSLLLGHTFFFIPNNLTKLGCQFLGLCLLQLSDASCGFRAHDATSPVTTDLKNKGYKF